jgi:hypothetical protein
LKLSAQRAAWLRVNWLLSEMRIPQDSEAGRGQFEQIMEQRRAQENGADWKKLHRGWCLGDETFRQELLDGVQGRAGENHEARTRRETTEEMALRLRAETSVTLKWIAERLHMVCGPMWRTGSSTRRRKPKPKNQSELRFV